LEAFGWFSPAKKEGDSAFSKAFGCATRCERLIAAARSFKGAQIGLVEKDCP
jgi:hypothetical protein